MNESVNEELMKQRNIRYYNQMLLKDRDSTFIKAICQQKKGKKRNSFATQEVNFKDFLLIPEKWEAFFYTLYGVFIPYLTGIVFLFFVVADGSYENFKLLNIILIMRIIILKTLN